MKMASHWKSSFLRKELFQWLAIFIICMKSVVLFFSEKSSFNGLPFSSSGKSFVWKQLYCFSQKRALSMTCHFHHLYKISGLDQNFFSSLLFAKYADNFSSSHLTFAWRCQRKTNWATKWQDAFVVCASFYGEQLLRDEMQAKTRHNHWRYTTISVRSRWAWNKLWGKRGNYWSFWPKWWRMEICNDGFGSNSNSTWHQRGLDSSKFPTDEIVHCLQLRNKWNENCTVNV